MLDKVRRNAFLIAAAFFLWQGWSSASATPEVTEDPEEASQEEVKLPNIRQSFLRAAAEGEVAGPEDPFHMLRRALAEQSAALKERNLVDTGSTSASSETAVSSSLVLRLESTMHANHRWIARINGRTLSVGDTLPGFDENQPPVLVSVEGTVAKLRYDGQIILLDLTGEASVSVD